MSKIGNQVDIFDKSLQDTAKEAQSNCQEGNHAWSSWIASYFVCGPRPPSWEDHFEHRPVGVGSYDISTRECLFCGHRQRQIAKRGARKELGGGLSTHEIADSVIVDLEK